MNNLLEKIKKAGLVGRGGACFPVWQKWSAVKDAVRARPPKERKCFVICNASEGEPDVKKDQYILENFPELVIKGIEGAIGFLGAKRGYLYLNSNYYKALGSKLEKHIGDANIEIIEKPHEAGYIGGEESSIINALEGKRIEPRFKPPYPVTSGLFGYPTLTNNVETFFNVARVINGNYKADRFYSIIEHGQKSSFGEVAGLKKFLKKEVFLFPADWSVDRILKESGRRPLFKFFVQVSGGASGLILNSAQLNEPAGGSGSITIYNLEKHNTLELIKHWMNFFKEESCGKCTPCREGTYRIVEQLQSEKPDWELIKEFLDNLSDTAFCGLGCAAPIAITSYFKNVFPLVSEIKPFLADAQFKAVCECFNK